IGIEHAAPALFRLPAPGRLLVSGSGGTWLVAADGSKRRLGDYTKAAWSPHGLFVVAATGNELATLEPRDGSVHWSLARPRIAFPRWGGSRTDTRVAYVTAGRLHVVDGAGTRRLFSAPARLSGLSWSPSGRWLLTTLPAADQWIFISGTRVLAVSHIARQFDGVPTLDGWMPAA